MKQINIWDLWAKEWKNADAFFNTKGNIKTKSRLKDKWHKDFKEMCEMIEREVRNSLTTNKPNNIEMMASILTQNVYTESGKLKHLVNDKKMGEYINSLITENKNKGLIRVPKNSISGTDKKEKKE